MYCMVRKSNQKGKKSGKATTKIEAKTGEFVALTQVGHVQSSLMPKSKDFKTPAVWIKFGFSAKNGMAVPVTKQNLDELRGALDIIEAQVL